MNYIGFIYEWTNINNGMRYIGSHKGTLDDGYTGSGKRFLKAVKKHGISSFSRNIIEMIYDESILLSREQYYLDINNCAKNKKYYNISPTAGGGDTGAGNKISSSHKRAFKNGTRQPWNKGKKLTDKQKEKSPTDVWEVCTPTGEIVKISNMLQFCKENGLNPSTMSAVARGVRGQHHGYKCRKLTNNREVPYEFKEYTYMTSDEKKQINSVAVKKAKQVKALPKIIFDGVTYNSIVEATYKTGKSRYLLVKYGTLLRNN